MSNAPSGKPSPAPLLCRRGTAPRTGHHDAGSLFKQETTVQYQDPLLPSGRAHRSGHGRCAASAGGSGGGGPGALPYGTHRLPPYRPPMNAAGPWIGWAKNVLSANTCWQDHTALVRSFVGFVASMTKRPGAVLRRCVPAMLGFKRTWLECPSEYMLQAVGHGIPVHFGQPPAVLVLGRTEQASQISHGPLPRFSALERGADRRSLSAQYASLPWAKLEASTVRGSC
jgi:hypothetical protein